MGSGKRKRRADLTEQLEWPWEWNSAPYQHLDGWAINKNRICRDKFLDEMGRDFGPFTVPHRRR